MSNKKDSLLRGEYSKGTLARAISFVERIGNVLPHPFFLFMILIGLIYLLSFILSHTGVSVGQLTFDPSSGQKIAKTIPIINLFEKEMLQSIMSNFVKTFIYFTPVGFVIIMIIGVSLAEQTGLFLAVIRQLIGKTPDYLVTFMLALVGVCANIVSDAGIVIVPAIGGAIFLALKRHPIAGVCAGYVAAYGGYSANIFVAGTDVMLAGITEAAIGFFNITAPVHPLMNWYAMIGSTLILATVVTIITEKIVVPYLGEYDPPGNRQPDHNPEYFGLSPQEKRGLRMAALASLLFLIVLLMMIIPKNGLLRNEAGKLLPDSPLISGIIFILFAYFFFAGLAYGMGAGTIRSHREIPGMMEKGLTGVAGFLVVCLPASIFIDLFHKSNLATVIAVSGANLFQSISLSGIPAVLMFALLCAILNIFVTSGLTQWMITAPIFVPLFYQLGLSPAITQMAFRIGDSTTNIISPISAYLPMLLGLLEKYRNRDQEIGIGSALSLMLPYSLGLFTFWLIYLGVWLLLGLDPGPGVSLYVNQ